MARGAMAQTTPPSRAAGAIIAFTTLAGAIVGTMAAQSSIGVIAGFGLGVAIALLLWLRDRRL